MPISPLVLALVLVILQNEKPNQSKLLIGTGKIVLSESQRCGLVVDCLSITYILPEVLICCLAAALLFGNVAIVEPSSKIVFVLN